MRGTRCLERRAKPARAKDLLGTIAAGKSGLAFNDRKVARVVDRLAVLISQKKCDPKEASDQDGASSQEAVKYPHQPSLFYFSDCLYRAGFFGEFAVLFLFRRSRLVVNEGIPAFFVAREVLWGFRTASVAIDALIIDKKLSSNVISPFFFQVSHTYWDLSGFTHKVKRQISGKTRRVPKFDPRFLPGHGSAERLRKLSTRTISLPWVHQATSRVAAVCPMTGSEVPSR